MNTDGMPIVVRELLLGETDVHEYQQFVKSFFWEYLTSDSRRLREIFLDIYFKHFHALLDYYRIKEQLERGQL